VGTLQIIKALADVAIELGYAVSEDLFRRDRSGLFLRVLRNGKPALVLHDASTGATVKLIPQRTYSPRSGALSSASYPQTPDIAVEIDEPGQPVRVVIFDPKYKLDSEEIEGEINDGRPKKVDIDKMHAYRDAIRDLRHKRAVEYAAIIYPGATTEEFGAGLQAISARPSSGVPHLHRAMRSCSYGDAQRRRPPAQRGAESRP
jgi:PD-(D/E)XK nuclease superfamily